MTSSNQIRGLFHSFASILSDPLLLEVARQTLVSIYFSRVLFLGFNVEFQAVGDTRGKSSLTESFARVFQ